MNNVAATQIVIFKLRNADKKKRKTKTSEMKTPKPNFKLGYTEVGVVSNENEVSKNTSRNK